MKKIFYIVTAVALVAFLCRCSEDDFSDQYRDPSKVTQSTVEKFFTGVLQESNELLLPGYMRYLRTYPNIGSISQTWGSVPSGSNPWNGFYPTNNDFWGWYLRTLTQWKICNKQWEDDGQPADKEVYVLCGKVAMYHVMLQALDVIGKLPYNEVGMYLATGELKYASLDDTKALYEQILDDLGEINTKLAGKSNIDAMTDYINDGNISKWRIFANSLRLRAAIRLSGCELHPELNNSGKNQPDATLTSKAQSIVKDIFNNASNNPVVTGTANEIAITNRGSGNLWWQSITTRDRYIDWPTSHTASQPMVDRLDRDGNGIISAGDDPRLSLFFDPVTGGDKVGKFVGIDPRENASVVTSSLSEPAQYSCVNERSFRDNKKFASFIVTPSEVAYYKAEAILRLGVSGDAKSEFVRGFRESVQMYAKINSESDCSTAEYLARSPLVVDAAWNATWSTANIDAYASSLWDAATDKLALVYEQFWIHNWLFNTVESWNSLRRTGVPADLYYPYLSDASSIKVVPARQIVPVDEHNKNANIPDESANVYKAGESYWEVIFWAKDLTKSANCQKP
jgi:hypothetical protein